MKVILDVKKTIDYLIKGLNFDEFATENHEICGGIFEEYRQKCLLKIAKIYKVIYFLKAVSNIQFSNLQHLLNSEDSALDLLFKRMGTDIIGPRTRMDTAKVSYLYGDENIENSWTKKLSQKINNIFVSEPKNMTFFEEVNFRLEQRLKQIKQTDESEAQKGHIFTIKQLLKLSKRVQLSIQGFIHEASAMRRLHFVATEIETHLNDSPQKDKLLQNIRILANLYQQYDCIDYKFSKEEGMTIGEEHYGPSDVLALRGRKLSAIRKKIAAQITNLTHTDFKANFIYVDNRYYTDWVSPQRYKHHLKDWVNQSAGYFTVKSEINSIFADGEDKLSSLGNSCVFAASCAGIIGAASMLFGGFLSFTPLMPVGQGMVWIGLGLSMIGISSSVIVTTKGMVFDPIAYGVSPKIKDVMALGILPVGLLTAGGLKFIANKELLGQLALGSLSFVDSSIKIPMQIKGAFSQRGQIKLIENEQQLRSDVFVLEEITREKILKLARNFLLQKPEKFDHILKLFNSQSNINDSKIIKMKRTIEDEYNEAATLNNEVLSNKTDRFFKTKIMIREQDNLCADKSNLSALSSANL